MRIRGRLAALGKSLIDRPCPRCGRAGPADPDPAAPSAAAGWAARLTPADRAELADLLSRVDLRPAACPGCGREGPPDLSNAGTDDLRRLSRVLGTAPGAGTGRG